MNAPMYLLLFIFTLIRSCIISKSTKNNLASLTHSSSPLLEPSNPQLQEIEAGKFPMYDFNKEKPPPGASQTKTSYDSTENTVDTIAENEENEVYIAPHLQRLICRTNDIPAIYYLFAALFDVEGNVLLLTAYEYTTITSVSLLDCFAIPMVMFWGILIFGRKYKWHHFIGIILSLSGMALLVYTDSIVNKADHRGINPTFGDILVLCGAVCYSISNSFAEYVVKYHQSIWKYLRMIGLYGFIITLIQGFIFEHNGLFHKNEYSIECMLYLCGYVLSLSVYYVAIPTLLQYSSAVVFNLSLLSADFWAVLAAVFLFSVTLNYLYFIAFVAIISGVVWYNIANYVYNVDN